MLFCAKLRCQVRLLSISHYQQAIEIAQAIGYRQGETEWSWHLGQLYITANPAQAVALMEKRVLYLEEIGHKEAEKYAQALRELRIEN